MQGVLGAFHELDLAIEAIEDLGKHRFKEITVYTPTFGSEVLHLAPVDNMILTLCVGLSNFIWLPVGGAISDRVGRPPGVLPRQRPLLTVHPDVRVTLPGSHRSSSGLMK